MIGIGVDVVEIERFRRSLERTPTMRDRLFTEIELAYVANQVDPVPSLAVRFAARGYTTREVPVPLDEGTRVEVELLPTNMLMIQATICCQLLVGWISLFAFPIAASCLFIFGSL